MGKETGMKPAIVVVDMLADNFDEEKDWSITREAKKIIPPLQHLLKECRSLGVTIIYANDSFLPNDFIFKGRMKETALRGTKGSEVIQALAPQPGDHIVPKRRFSGFFKTDLDQTLRLLDVDTVVSCGIATHICVLANAMDALCHDFRSIILEDCTAANTREIHEATLNNYRRTPIYPLFRVMDSRSFLEEVRESSFK
jgi:nicotinamidase-related amidase